MGSELKEEFKEFIETLSVDICKDVLIEELTKLNNDFNVTSTNYKKMLQEYITVSSFVRKETEILNRNNSKLGVFINCINGNSEKINEALKLIHGEHKEIINQINVDNKKIFEEHSKKVQELNELERKKFILELNNKLNIESKHFSDAIKKSIDIDKITLISKAIVAVDNRVVDCNDRIIYIQKETKNINRKNIEIEEELKKITKLLEESQLKQDNIINRINEIDIDTRDTNYSIKKYSAVLGEFTGNKFPNVGFFGYIYIVIILLGIVVLFK